MIINNKFNIQNKFKRSVIAIGNFDGIHRGHQKVLKEASMRAKHKKINFGVLSFEPIPVMFFNKKLKYHRLHSINQKKKYLNQKADFVIIKKFDKTFSNLSYKNFIKKIIFQKLNAKYIFVSKNFKYGKNRLGNVSLLKSYENKYNFTTIITKPFKRNEKIVSSTIIRSLISKGQISKANYLLGRPWSIEGKVMPGNKRGRTIGYPTCNLDLKNYIKPKYGVYSVDIFSNSFKGKKGGIANVGLRPTFQGKKLLLEVNIFNFKKNLYKKKINVVFKKFIRPEKKFKNINDLKKQIKKDISKI